MNRNVMYDYLKEEIGMYPMFIYRDRNRAYHTKFVLNKGQIDCRINTEWGYIRHVEAIHLCMNELVIESKYSDMKVNIFYKDIEKFEVEIEWNED